MADPSDKPLAGREVLLCVTGGIACYKSADLTSKLVQAGAGVTVAMTAAARRFIRPMTFEALTGRKVYHSMWRRLDEGYPHLALAERADLMIVAPATANILAKMAHGLADDLVSALCLSSHNACDVLLAPAMNTRMYQAPATQTNVQTLRDRGAHVVGPEPGRLACGTEGPGRMSEPADILTAAVKVFSQG